MGRDKEGLRHRAQQGAGQSDIQDTEVHWLVVMMMMIIFIFFSFAKGGEGENGRLDLPLVLPLSSPPPLLSCSLLDTGE